MLPLSPPLAGMALLRPGAQPNTEEPPGAPPPSPADAFKTLPLGVRPIPITAPVNPVMHGTPLPDYGNAKSRLQYVGSLLNKYGSFMQGRGDTPLNVNEIPRGGTDTAKNMTTRISSKYGLDPALLYSSAMEEGMSGLFKSKATGIDTKGRKPGDFGYQDFYADKEYPVSGKESFGLNTFPDRFMDLVKGGYLPKEFAANFRTKDDTSVGAFKGDFKSVDAALQAKAAMVKYNMDDISKFAASKGIALSDKAKQFFALIGYNGGEGSSHKMMMDYQRNNLLKDDNFIYNRPTTGVGLSQDSYKTIHENVSRRFKMRDMLKKEQLF